MIEVVQILNLQSQKTADWHNEIRLSENNMLPWGFIEENHMYNFLLWHEEDIARIKHIDPLRMVLAKQNIDKYNQCRNNAMEKIDEWILSYLATKGIVSSDVLHSETPGMMIDRLSIMSLKKYHMDEEAKREDASIEHKGTCSKKVIILNEQIKDLASCISNILELLNSGKLRFKVYRQFKMYNDPSLNPQLYKKSTNLV